LPPRELALSVIKYFFCKTGPGADNLCLSYVRDGSPRSQFYDLGGVTPADIANSRFQETCVGDLVR